MRKHLFALALTLATAAASMAQTTGATVAQGIADDVSAELLAVAPAAGAVLVVGIGIGIVWKLIKKSAKSS